MAVFPSAEWVVAYRDAINANPRYREAAATWDLGALALVCKAKAGSSLAEDVAIWLDLHLGECRAARLIPLTEMAGTPFVLTAEYDRWKQVIKGELDPIKALLQGKIRLKGNLAAVVRFVGASKALVATASLVETRFVDE